MAIREGAVAFTPGASSNNDFRVFTIESNKHSIIKDPDNSFRDEEFDATICGECIINGKKYILVTENEQQGIECYGAYDYGVGFYTATTFFSANDPHISINWQ